MRVSTREEFEAWCEHKTLDFGLTRISHLSETKTFCSQCKYISVGFSVDIMGVIVLHRLLVVLIN